MSMVPTYQLVRAAKQFIRNSKLPTCSSCIFYQENTLNKKKQMLCNKFGVKNIISGSIVYDNVLEARFDNDKCGEKGEHYVEKYTKN
jgi:hypothetical protein